MGLLEPGRQDRSGGTAMLDRPKPKEEERDWRDNLRKAGRTVGVALKEVINFGGEKIEGESEPRHDGAYERAPIRLRQEDGVLVNANEFSFKSSLDWPGPLVAFLVHDADGKAIARAITHPYMVKADTQIAVAEGKATFERIDR